MRRAKRERYLASETCSRSEYERGCDRHKAKSSTKRQAVL